jgi:signal transduction histidine kinase
VSPGEHIFRVIAANNDGVWNEVGSVIRIKVIPPFHKTSLFFVLLALVLAAIAVLIYLNRMAQLTRLNEARALYTRGLIESQEQERSRIALELHDSVGQSLAVIRNRALMGLNTPDDQARVLDQMQEISEASAIALQETRQIAHDLHPHQLDHLGLSVALRSMIDMVGDSSPVEIDSSIEDLHNELPRETSIAIFRIVQECLNNIIKHSDASRASVSLVRRDGKLIVEIVDDGRGFAATGINKGLGLRGIRERADMIGARLRIDSSTGSGTSVALSMELPSTFK